MQQRTMVIVTVVMAVVVAFLTLAIIAGIYLTGDRAEKPSISGEPETAPVVQRTFRPEPGAKCFVFADSERGGRDIECVAVD